MFTIMVTVGVLLAGGVLTVLLCVITQAVRAEREAQLGLSRRQRIDLATFHAIRCVQARYQAAAEIALRQAVARQWQQVNEARRKHTDRRP
jgi:hypothetical protein